MSRYVFKMPDLGEGTVTAEVVEWKVKVGDTVTEDQIIAEVMTDKAAVEIPAPVSGRVVSITGQPGDMVAVGSELIAFETSAEASVAPAAPATTGRAGCCPTGARGCDSRMPPRQRVSWLLRRPAARPTSPASISRRSMGRARAAAFPRRISSRSSRARSGPT